MTGERPIGDDDLQAYVDGRLPPERRQAVENFLSDHPTAAAQATAYREHGEALRARLAFKAAEPIPARLRVAHILAERRRVTRRRSAAAAAAAFWLAIGGILGWFGNSWLAVRKIADAPGAGTLVASDAISAHRTFAVEIVHPLEVRADEEAHLVQWLSKRLGRPLHVPDLTPLGFRLMGGRLLPGGEGAAAQFMYVDDRGLRLTLYVRAGESGETAFRFVTAGEVSAFYWIDDGLGYVVSAVLGRERLSQAADAVYRQLDRNPSQTPRVPL